MSNRRAEPRFRPLQDLIDAYMVCAVRLAGGDMTEAAELLGIGRSTLYRHRSQKMTETRDRARESGSAFQVRQLRDRIAALRKATEAAAEDKAQANSYQLGKANGLIQALHTMEGGNGTPQYL